MSALLDKMNSLPKNSSVVIGGEDAENNETATQENTDGAEPTTLKDKAPSTPKEDSPAPEKEASLPPGEDQEPAANAPKAEKEAYKQRKIKAADEEKAEAKAETEKYKKELEEARREREEWKKQAQTVASRDAENRQPLAEKTKENADPDISKDPVGYLAKGLDEVNNRFKVLEHQQTVTAAMSELAELETASASKLTDYQDVMKHAEDSEVAKLKLMNPNVNEAAVRQGFKADKVKAAVMFISQGKDPVEGIYNLAKVGYGYQPKQKPVDEKADAAKEKADAEKSRFDAVNKNKSRSATGLAAGGSTTETEVRGPQTTAKRSLRDFAKLTKEQKDADYIQR